MTVVLDYGVGNLRSVQKAIEHIGFPCRIQGDLAGVTRLVIPGVGAFARAMQMIAPIADEVRALARDGVPILGLCLGQQLLFESSAEHGRHNGLGILKGTVEYLEGSEGNKVPNIGWCEVEPRPGSPMFQGVPSGAQFYFVHSLHTVCAEESDVAAQASHTKPFTAAVKKSNVWATQFHPEKSGKVGLQVLRNFLEC